MIINSSSIFLGNVVDLVNYKLQVCKTLHDDYINPIFSAFELVNSET
jgi:hypothetical protein